MAYQPFYEIVDWQNRPSQQTPLNRTNLLHAENGIKEADRRIVELDNIKLNVETANTMVKSVSVDADTGVITVTLLNGAVITYDLDIERVVLNFDITDDNILVLTLADGTQKKVDLTKFVYTFGNSDTITLHSKDRVVTAEIVDGSVTMAKLDAAIQAEFRECLREAEAARDLALQYQQYAKRYALGDSEFEGSETDNSKYYCEESKRYAELAQEITGITYPDMYIDIETGYLYAEGGSNLNLYVDERGHLISEVTSTME